MKYERSLSTPNLKGKNKKLVYWCASCGGYYIFIDNPLISGIPSTLVIRGVTIDPSTFNDEDKSIYSVRAGALIQIDKKKRG
jgi:hypothetical protein